MDTICRTLVADRLQGLLHTGPDTEAQGCEVAKMLNELTGGEGNVLIIEGLASTAPAIRRTDGFRRCLDPGITVLDAQRADWDKAKATIVTRDLLTRYGDQVDAIYGHDGQGSRVRPAASPTCSMNRRDPARAAVHLQRPMS